MLGLAVSTVPLTTGSAFASVQTCLSGTLQYKATDAESGTSLPQVTSNARNTNWELRGQTTAGGTDTQLAVGNTDASGNFNACYNGSTALPSVYIRFYSASTGMWRVVTDKNSSTLYSFDSGTQTNASGNINLGNVSVPSDKVYAFKIVDVLNDLWFKRGSTTPCWTSNQTSNCDQLIVAWGANNADGSIFDLNTRKVLLNSNEPDSKHLILHEAGHWLQWQLFDKWDVPVTGCTNHTFNKISSATCAWSEGFADAVAAYTLGDYRYVFKGGTSYDFTNDQNTAGWDKGDQVQARVSSSLLDLWASGGPDGGNWNKTISVMTNHQSSDFHDYFVNGRPTGGLSTTGAANDILVKHTINY
ncbi:metalloprotease [Streptomyces tubercidicus]|uniref:metalloprotease n=1 Tax=Streptomyces tubercidicus TaxID=47759 RepID=UPI0036888807